ncbi:MAG TPA: UDP-N-acetylmuramoyl-L-alanine--D-glutamate ligase, partial [Planctomicrobium sp.]|nr:UDP-N-acetylmuramoyl-L-alanine--D-glutamate ligase [Planctomicrobium sp.]
GGVGVVRFLQKQGAHVTVTDLQTAEQLAKSLEKIDTASLTGLVLGEHRDELFTETDLVVVNPAVRPGNRFVQLVLDAGIPVTSEIALFWERCPARKLVVTGSTGKSTTATLIAQCLQAGLETGEEGTGRSVKLGGNLGISLLEEVDSFTADDWVVLELSSFQLASLDSIHPRPDVAVVTNLFPNHLDWHESFEDYQAAKQTVCAWQTSDDLSIFNADDASLPLWPTDAKVIWYGKECWRDRPGVVVGEDHLIVRAHTGGWKVELSDLAPALQSPHGLMNAAAALAAVVVGLEVSIDVVAAPLLNFAGLPHRLQVIGEVDGRLFINDSKATTPEAAMAGLVSMQQPVILIAGGKSKGVDLELFAESIQENVKAVVFIGETAPRLQELVIERHQAANAREKRPRRSEEPSVPRWISTADSLHHAVMKAWEESESGDVILLSPGCASSGEFTHYEQRGESFCNSMRAIAEKSH